jgi:hypothetical protein
MNGESPNLFRWVAANEVSSKIWILYSLNLSIGKCCTVKASFGCFMLKSSLFLFLGRIKWLLLVYSNLARLHSRHTMVRFPFWPWKGETKRPGSTTFHSEPYLTERPFLLWPNFESSQIDPGGIGAFRAIPGQNEWGLKEFKVIIFACISMLKERLTDPLEILKSV